MFGKPVGEGVRSNEIFQRTHLLQKDIAFKLISWQVKKGDSSGTHDAIETVAGPSHRYMWYTIGSMSVDSDTRMQFV